MNENQFEALLGAVERLTQSIVDLESALGVNIAALQDNLDEVSRSIDAHAGSIAEIAETITGREV